MSSLLFVHFQFIFTVLMRQPGYWGPTVVMPCLLYMMFGASLMGEGPMVNYAIGAFAVYAVAGVAFFQFGVSLAQDRTAPFEKWRQLLPVVPHINWVAQTLAAGVFALIAMGLVVIAGVMLGGYQPGWLDIVRLILACAVILLPAGLMGILLGLSVSGQAATAVAMIIFLPLSYLGGLWVPVDILPKFIQQVSWLTPTRHMLEFTWAMQGLDQRETWFPALLLLVDTVLFFLLCRLRVWHLRRS